MIAIRYDSNSNINEIHRIAMTIQEKSGEKVICFPQDIDVLFNFSLSDLIRFRDYINKCIEEKASECSQ